MPGPCRTQSPHDGLWRLRCLVCWQETCTLLLPLALRPSAGPRQRGVIWWLPCSACQGARRAMLVLGPVPADDPALPLRLVEESV